MSAEIERKFLIRELPPGTLSESCLCIQQGYIALDPSGKEVRLRKSNEQFYLTVKSGGTLQREEYEIEIQQSQFETLWPSTEGKRLRKDRYLIDRDGYTIEIDVYHQPLKGLIVAEVEFDSEGEANLFVKEDWMGQEVTHLNFLKNKNLLQFESLEDLKSML